MDLYEESIQRLSSFDNSLYTRILTSYQCGHFFPIAHDDPRSWNEFCSLVAVL